MLFAFFKTNDKLKTNFTLCTDSFSPSSGKILCNSYHILPFDIPPARQDKIGCEQTGHENMLSKNRSQTTENDKIAIEIWLGLNHQFISSVPNVTEKEKRAREDSITNYKSSSPIGQNILGQKGTS